MIAAARTRAAHTLIGWSSQAGLWIAMLVMAVLAASTPAHGAASPGEPSGSSLGMQVIDQTGTLTAGQTQALETRLQALEQEKGAQIAVLMVKSTDGESIEQYAVKVFERWRLGRKDIDDGLLLVIAKEDRTLRIEVGYGLEGAVTDAQANRIIEEQIVPRFAQGDFAGGVQAGVDSLINLVRGEALPPPVIKPADTGQSGAGMSGRMYEVLFGMSIILLSAPVWMATIVGAVLGFMFFNGLSFVILGAVAGTVISLIGRLFMRGKRSSSVSASRRGRSRGAFGAGLGTGGFAGGGRSSSSSSHRSGGFSGGGGRSGGGGASGRW